MAEVFNQERAFASVRLPQAGTEVTLSESITSRVLQVSSWPRRLFLQVIRVVFIFPAMLSPKSF